MTVFEEIHLQILDLPSKKSSRINNNRQAVNRLSVNDCTFMSNVFRPILNKLLKKNDINTIPICTYLFMTNKMQL